jgi:hypothetical protein
MPASIPPTGPIETPPPWNATRARITRCRAAAEQAGEQQLLAALLRVLIEADEQVAASQRNTSSEWMFQRATAVDRLVTALALQLRAESS